MMNGNSWSMKSGSQYESQYAEEKFERVKNYIRPGNRWIDYDSRVDIDDEEREDRYFLHIDISNVGGCTGCTKL